MFAIMRHGDYIQNDRCAVSSNTLWLNLLNAVAKHGAASNYLLMEFLLNVITVWNQTTIISMRIAIRCCFFHEFITQTFSFSQSYGWCDCVSLKNIQMHKYFFHFAFLFYLVVCCRCSIKFLLVSLDSALKWKTLNFYIVTVVAVLRKYHQNIVIAAWARVYLPRV